MKIASAGASSPCDCFPNHRNETTIDRAGFRAARTHRTRDRVACAARLFAEEIDKLNLVDGLLINLRDANSEFLICLKIRFTAEFEALEKTYYRYKVALSGDAQNLNARAFHSRGIVQCDLESASESQRNLLRAWKLQEIAAMAILDDDDFSQAPMGTLLLLKQEGQIGDDVFIAVEQLITLFYQPLRQALEASFLREDRAA